jgi:hypothetical protein
MHIGGGDVVGDGQTQGIDQQMPFTPRHTLVRVVAANACRFLDGLHALAVQDGRTRVRMAADALTFGSMQGGIEEMPDALEAKAPDMIRHRLPRREVGGQIPPRAAGA